MKKLIPVVLLVVVTMRAGVARAQTCPNLPTPPCATTGSVTLLFGSYGCTDVRARNDNTVQVGVLRLTANGAGAISGVQASNSNQTGSNTYKDFTTQSLSATYCVNSDNTTGYISPPVGQGCPVAMVLGSVTGGVANQVRLISTSARSAESITCKLQ